MPIAEIAVWSAMLGGLLTLAALALADVLGGRTIGAVRNLLFVLITGASCVVMTGLLEVFFPALPDRLLMVLKAGLGPLAGAMGLYFVGTWLGGAREDGVVHRLTALGGIVLVCAAIALALLASQTDPEHFDALLVAAAVVNMVPVLLALVAALRAARRGDPLARWMALAIGCLALMTGAHYLHGLRVPGLGLGAWVFTAVVTVLFFLIASVLGLLRNRHNRELARLSRLQQGADPATGLPTGSALIADVEHAFWRAARLQDECAVLCLYVSNLYEMNEAVGPGAEHQILVTMAARIRRSAGFRCVVGLYHPRCFVVVLSMDKHQAPVRATAARLALTVSHPMVVFNEQRDRQPFRPRVGLGVVLVDPAGATPLDVINEAERQALAMAGSAPRDSEHGIVTAPAPLL
ncbi:MAG: GGDEF domain-containing protein [Hydrogenophaga sp.]|nr:GGDEF domain-containing protein [Hydrogenophaga sp.]